MKEANIFIKIAEHTPILKNHIRRARTESREVMMGDSTFIRGQVLNSVFGPQETFPALRKKLVPVDPEFEETEKKIVREEKREGRRWIGDLVTIGLFGAAVVGFIHFIVPPLNQAAMDSRYTSQENPLFNAIFNGGEHGPMTTQGIKDGCNLFDSTLKNSILDHYIGIFFTADINAQKDGMKEFFNNIQSESGWNYLDSFLKEKGVNDNFPDSVQFCRSALSAYKEDQQGKTQNGLQNFKDYLSKHSGYSSEDIQKLERVINKVYK